MGAGGAAGAHGACGRFPCRICALYSEASSRTAARLTLALGAAPSFVPFSRRAMRCGRGAGNALRLDPIVACGAALWRELMGIQPGASGRHPNWRSGQGAAGMDLATWGSGGRRASAYVLTSGNRQCARRMGGAGVVVPGRAPAFRWLQQQRGGAGAAGRWEGGRRSPRHEKIAWLPRHNREVAAAPAFSPTSAPPNCRRLGSSAASGRRLPGCCPPLPTGVADVPGKTSPQRRDGQAWKRQESPAPARLCLPCGAPLARSTAIGQVLCRGCGGLEVGAQPVPTSGLRPHGPQL